MNEELKKIVREFIDAHPSRNLSNVSKAAGLSPNTLRYWMEEGNSIKISSLDKIIKYMESRGFVIIWSVCNFE